MSENNPRMTDEEYYEVCEVAERLGYGLKQAERLMALIPRDQLERMIRDIEVKAQEVKNNANND